jgi:hypothetical protein
MTTERGPPGLNRSVRRETVSRLKHYFKEENMPEETIHIRPTILQRAGAILRGVPVLSLLTFLAGRPPRGGKACSRQWQRQWPWCR